MGLLTVLGLLVAGILGALLLKRSAQPDHDEVEDELDRAYAVLDIVLAAVRFDGELEGPEIDALAENLAWAKLPFTLTETVGRVAFLSRSGDDPKVLESNVALHAGELEAHDRELALQIIASLGSAAPTLRQRMRGYRHAPTDADSDALVLRFAELLNITAERQRQLDQSPTRAPFRTAFPEQMNQWASGKGGMVEAPGRRIFGPRGSGDRPRPRPPTSRARTKPRRKGSGRIRFW